MTTTVLSILGFVLLAFFVTFIIYGLYGYAKQVYMDNRR